MGLCESYCTQRKITFIFDCITMAKLFYDNWIFWVGLGLCLSQRSQEGAQINVTIHYGMGRLENNVYQECVSDPNGLLQWLITAAVDTIAQTRESFQKAFCSSHISITRTKKISINQAIRLTAKPQIFHKNGSVLIQLRQGTPPNSHKLCWSCINNEPFTMLSGSTQIIAISKCPSPERKGT